MTSGRSSPGFPIPEGMEGFWQWDKMHCPRPQTPITEEIFLAAVSKGFSTGMDEFASPVGLRYKVVNYFGYISVYPLPLGEESMDDRIARYQATMRDVLPRMGDLWENEWLPSILPGLEKARSTDYAALSDDQLFETLGRDDQGLHASVHDPRQDQLRYRVRKYVRRLLRRAVQPQRPYRALFDPPGLPHALSRRRPRPLAVEPHHQGEPGPPPGV